MITREIKYFSDYKGEWEKSTKEYGTTSRHRTGIPQVDIYLGGGYGKDNSFELISVYGRPGVGKSMFGLRMIVNEILKGTKIAAMFLEDDMGELLSRIERLVDGDFQEVLNCKNVEILPEDATDEMWELEEVYEWLEHKINQGIELIYIDHLQFLYENDNADSSDMYQRHRIFMKKVNKLFKKTKTTAIIISHVNKNTQAKGIDKMIGSSSLGGAVTKAIEVFKDGDGNTFIELTKSRYTRDQVGNPLAIDILKGKAHVQNPFNH